MNLGKSSLTGMPSKNLNKATSLLEKIGMESFHPYENFHQGLTELWSYLVGCKNKECRDNWQSNSALIEVAIHEGLNVLNSGKPPLRYLDGSIMKRFQVPHKVFEREYCRRDPIPKYCKLLSSYKNHGNVACSSFDVRGSTIGKNAGRGVFSTKNISKGSLIALEMGSNTIRIYPDSKYIIDTNIHVLEKKSELYAVFAYMYEYGFSVQFYNGNAYFVDGSIMTYVNHGCNSTNNLGWYYLQDFNTQLNEQFALPETFNEIVLEKYYYNPLYLRHIELLHSGFDFASKDISNGEELFQNYLMYESTMEDFMQVGNELKILCAGFETGFVTNYESGSEIFEVNI